MTVLSECINALIDDRTIRNMQTTVNKAADTQDITFTNSIGRLRSDPAYCNTYKFTLSPAYSFLTISASTLTLSTTAPTDTGTYNINLAVSLTDYPMVPVVNKPFTVVIGC